MCLIACGPQVSGYLRNKIIVNSIIIVTPKNNYPCGIFRLENIKGLALHANYLILSLNPWAAELSAFIFHSFEAGIANAISNFK